MEAYMLTVYTDGSVLVIDIVSGMAFNLNPSKP